MNTQSHKSDCPKRAGIRAWRRGRVSVFAVCLAGALVAQPAGAWAFSTDIIIIATRVMEMTQEATSAAGKVASRWLQSLADAKTKQAQIDAARTDVNAAAAGDIARKLSMPPDENYCAKAKASRGQQIMAESVNLLAAAQSRGNTTPVASPAGAVKDLVADFEYGLAPCTRSTDAEAKRNKRMGCKSVWGGRWERADMSLMAIFGATQYPVPPGFDSVSLAGYDGLPVPKKITDEKYMPFIAAYSACLKLTKRMPPLPSSSSSGGATLSDVDALKDTQNIGMCSAAQDMCKKFVFDRGQFSAEANSEINRVQKDTCERLTDKHYQDSSAGCPDGMSTVKSYDIGARRLSAESFQSLELRTATPDAYGMQVASAFSDELGMEMYVVEQMSALASSMSATVDDCYSGTDTASARKASK